MNENIKKQKSVLNESKENEFEKLKRKNKYKNIIIIIMGIIIIINAVILAPIVKRKCQKFINEKMLEKQQAQNAENYNSKYKLNLISAYGDIEAYHPKILSFEQKWNGYYYWMSFTPYPDSDSSKENPHIVASNDMVNWEEPAGFKNPIDEVKNYNEKKYNSDSHIVMNTDLNRLECYWRYVNDEENKAIIYRSYTTDGIQWSDKQIAVISNDRKNKDYVSPAIIYDEGIYKIWYIGTGNILTYAESKDGTDWKDIKVIKMEYPDKLSSWHLDVIKTDIGYEMLIMAYTTVKERGNASLYYTTSSDNTNWSTCTEIIKPTSKTKYWDNRGIYRSSMIKKDGIYYVFYSASNKDNIKGTGIMYGRDIQHLKKVDIDFINDKNAADKFKELIQKESQNSN